MAGLSEDSPGTAPVLKGVRAAQALPSFRLRSPRLEEEERFRVLVKMTAQELANGVPDSGHLYASLRAGRTLASAGDLQEAFGGMDQVTGRTSQGKPCWRVRLFPAQGPPLPSPGRAPAAPHRGPPLPGPRSHPSVPAQVRLMKRIAETADLTPVLKKLPRIKKHLLNRDSLR